MNFILGVIVGLLIGWNLLPQPEFVRQGWGWGWGNLKKVLNEKEEIKTQDSANTAE